MSERAATAAATSDSDSAERAGGALSGSSNGLASALLIGVALSGAGNMTETVRAAVSFDGD